MKKNIFIIKDCKCPTCGSIFYLKALYPDGKETKGIYYCATGRELTSKSIRKCDGLICYCERCETYHPSYFYNSFGSACSVCGHYNVEYTLWITARTTYKLRNKTNILFDDYLK